jgi:hypothetical protein
MFKRHFSRWRLIHNWGDVTILNNQIQRYCRSLCNYSYNLTKQGEIDDGTDVILEYILYSNSHRGITFY